MRPLYFGRGPRRLFGVYEPPDGQASRDEAVLLCYPAPQEYMQVHWAFRKLTRLLTSAGFHVLRFDYYGTGDSSGDGSDGSLEHWREDIRTAAGELTDLSGSPRLSAVGYRLGATLAASSPLQLRQLVLWEPVVYGVAHIAELCALHRRRFAHLLDPPRLPRHAPLGELVGQMFPPALQAGLEALTLAPPFSCQAEQVQIVTTSEPSRFEALLEQLGPRARLEHVPEEQGDGFFHLSVLAQRRIAERLAGSPR